MHDARLLINGVSYGGWKSLSIHRGMEDFAHSFDFRYADKWERDADPFPIFKGDSAKVAIDDDVAITGKIEDLNADYDAQSYDMGAGGRSRTGDLVDCSAVVKNRRWKDSTIRKIASEICEPFSIKVFAGRGNTDEVIDAKLPRTFALERDERCFDALSRLAALRGLVLQSTVDGDVRFTRAGVAKSKTVLRFGENIISARYASSDRDRFSHYYFRGQTDANDNWNGQDAVSIKGEAIDPEIAWYRPYMVHAQTQADRRDLGHRAIWERNTRAGRAETLTYTVQGWRHEDGVWAPNLRVPVEDSRLRIRAEMLISAVTLVASAGDAGGFVAELELVDPRAYELVGTPKPKRKPRQSLEDITAINLFEPMGPVWMPGRPR